VSARDVNAATTARFQVDLDRIEHHYERLSNGLMRLWRRKDVSATDKEILLDATNTVMWDDAIHVAAPWDERTTLCGNWDRNRVALDAPRPGGMEGCWTCLLTAEWLDKNLVSGRADADASSSAVESGSAPVPTAEAHDD
jgi:hypothetical protein